MRETLNEFLQSQAGTLLIAMVAVAFVDFATGVLAALRDGTFALDAIAAFVRKHLLGRVVPIGILLVTGYFGGELIGQLFLAAALGSAGAYVAETAASILGNLNPPKDSDVKEETVAETLNPVPTE
jgi:hypothetical protein